jgi:hypothetical protein
LKRDAVGDLKLNVADVDVVLGRAGPETMTVSGLAATAVEVLLAPSNAATNTRHTPKPENPDTLSHPSALNPSQRWVHETRRTSSDQVA